MRVLTFVWGGMLALGALFLIGALVTTYNTWESRRTIATTTGVIVTARQDAEEVEFSAADNKTYKVAMATSTPGAYNRGMKVPVAYETADPNHARLDIDPWETPRFLWIWAMGFILIGGIPLAATLWQQRRDEWLKANGQAVEADFAGVHVNNDYVVNGKKPYQVHALGQRNTFKSDNYWTDPTPYLRPGKITVMIDPANPKRYWMDLSYLPK